MDKRKDPDTGKTSYRKRLRQSFAYYSDKWSDGHQNYHYQTKKSWLINTIQQYFQRQMKSSKTLQILDAGCGNGMYLFDLVESLENSYGTGVDLTAEMISAAKRRASNVAGEFDWICMDLENGIYTTNFQNRTYDVVLMAGVVCYFGEMKKVFSSLRSVLDPNGRLIIIQHDPYKLTNFVLRIQSWLEPEFIWVSNISKSKIISEAESVGYSLESIQLLPCGGLPNPLYRLGQVFWDGYGLVFRC